MTVVRFAYCTAASAATLLVGLMAGFFFAFAVDVAPAMAQLDASGYVTTQQWINRTVRNAAFGATYFGSAVLPFVAALLAWAAGLRVRAWAWAALALFYFTSVFWLTREINVPINNLVAGWNAAAPPAEWAVLRDRWNEANLWRALGAALSFVAALAVLQAPARRARATA
jgi:uncharacterized membrane protein